MIKGAHHTGISVANLDRAIDFYRQGLGMELVVRVSFDSGSEDGRYEKMMKLENASGEIAVLRVGGLQLELFQFAHPKPKPLDPDRPICDHGITHFGIEVNDIDAVCERLKHAGATFHCPPLLFFGRIKATYVRDLDGNVFELVDPRPTLAAESVERS